MDPLSKIKNSNRVVWYYKKNYVDGEITEENHVEKDANTKQNEVYKLTIDTSVLTLKIQTPNTVARYQENIAKKDQVEGAIKTRQHAVDMLTINTWVFPLKNNIPN